MTDRLEKQPAETLIFNMVYASPPFRTGEAIASVSSLTASPVGNVTEVTPLTVTPYSYSGTTLQMTIGGGTSGEDYKITGRVVTDGTPAQTIEMEGFLTVTDS